MADFQFTPHNDTQAFVTVTHFLGKDELFVNVENDRAHIRLSIEQRGEEKGDIQLSAEAAQQVFDWLKSKGIVS